MKLICTHGDLNLLGPGDHIICYKKKKIRESSQEFAPHSNGSSMDLQHSSSSFEYLFTS